MSFQTVYRVKTKLLEKIRETKEPEDIDEDDEIER